MCKLLEVLSLSLELGITHLYSPVGLIVPLLLLRMMELNPLLE